MTTKEDGLNQELLDRISTDLSQGRWAREGASVRTEEEGKSFRERLRYSVEERGDAWALYGGYLALELKAAGGTILDEWPHQREAGLRALGVRDPFYGFSRQLMSTSQA